MSLTFKPNPETQAALADVVQHTADYAIFLLDTEGIVRTWNDGAERIKGYEAEEIIGRHFSIFYPAEDIASHKPEYELRVAGAEGRFEDIGWRLRKDGSLFWANVIITARKDAAGKLVGYAKITRDITERKQAEDALRASEERYRLLVDNVKDYAIFLLDASGRVRTWNQGAERIKGYSKGEIIGEHFSRFYTEEDRARGRPQHLLAIATREGRVEDEGWRVRKDSTRFWADVVITAIHGRDGNLAGFSKVTRDLTERREAETRRAELAREARESGEAAKRLEAFSYTVAHDLRAPIRAIHTLAEVLSRDHAASFDADANDLVARIRYTSDKMSRLVDNLLNFSRADKGDIHAERVDLAKLVQHIVRNTLLKREPDRVGDLVLGDDLTVTADPALIRIVMDNLVGNAWKFTSKTPRYRIEVRKLVGDKADTIMIKDNGAGFPPHRAQELFEPFRRLHDVNEFPGTGIGLSTVQRIIERHGGRVWAESEPGKGAAFYFTLPRAPDPAGGS